MFYEEKIEITRAEELLKKCDLSIPEGVEYTVGIFDDMSGSLVATCSLKGDMIQGIAVDPTRQGEDLMGKLLTNIIAEAGRRGLRSLHLFTKPDKSVQFQGLGLRQVAVARPYAALLEWGDGGIRQYQAKLKEIREAAEARWRDAQVGNPLTAGAAEPKAAALVMNCNPFTKGHRYLVEQAAQKADIVYLIVVEEDRSLFPFKDRFEMVRRGVADIENVTVLSGDRYAVSSLTFPSYFTKEENLAYAHTAMDAELFGRCIAPTLGVTLRMVGEEPLSPVTAIYNEALQSRLPGKGIEVQVIPRKESGDQPISASRVRALLVQLWERGLWIESMAERGTDVCVEQAQKELAEILPVTTYEYLAQPEFRSYLEEALSQGKR